MPNLSSPGSGDTGPSRVVPEWLESLAGEAERADGQPPFSDQSLVDLALGSRDLLAIGKDAAAIASATEAELVVRPEARHRGLGTALLARLLERTGAKPLIWAHGDHPDAAALATRFGFVPVRRLLQLRAGVAVDGSGTGHEYSVAAFRPGLDDDQWLALNAKAFAHHPEQGRLTAADLDARRQEAWFDAEDFLLLRDASGRLIGFCWLKVEDAIGEFYAVGVDPQRQGKGLGRVLVQAGLDRLAGRGIREASLYVEADNAAALRLYRSFGFTEYSVDIQYGPAKAQVQ